MTVASTPRKAGPFDGNGVTTNFPFDFKVFDKTDVAVLRTNTIGQETPLVLDSDYTVTLNGDQDAVPGGTIIYTGPPVLPAGWKLTVLGATDYDQQTDITNVGRFNPEVIEKTLDRTVIQVQQLAEMASRSVKVQVSSTTNPAELIEQLLTSAEETLAARNATFVARDVTLAATDLALLYRNQAQASAASAGNPPLSILHPSFGIVGDGSPEGTKATIAATVARAAKRPLYIPTAPAFYNFDGADWTGNGLRIIGDGMPQYAEDFSRMVVGTGTIIAGTIDMTGSNNSIVGVGIDNGEWMRVNKFGGAYREGLRNTAAGNPDDLPNYNKNFHAENVRILLPPADAGNPATWGHCFLAERVIGVTGGNIECHGGYHGFVLKSLLVSFGDVIVHGQLGSTYILKADALSSLAGLMEIKSIRIGHPRYTAFTNGRGIIESNGRSIYNVHIGAILASNCDTPVIRLGDQESIGVAIDYLEYTDGNDFVAVVKIDGGARDWKFTKHRIRNCLNGFLITGGTSVDIGFGSVTQAAGDAYVVQGDITHGVLYAINCVGYPVRNNGCENVNPLLVYALNAGTGPAVSSLSNFIGSVTLTSPWSDGGGLGLSKFGGMGRLRGSITISSGSSSSTTVLNVGVGLRPPATKVGFVPVFDNAGAGEVLRRFELYPSGDLLVIGANTLPAGSRIWLDTVSWFYNAPA